MHGTRGVWWRRVAFARCRPSPCDQIRCETPALRSTRCSQRRCDASSTPPSTPAHSTRRRSRHRPRARRRFRYARSGVRRGPCRSSASSRSTANVAPMPEWTFEQDDDGLTASGQFTNGHTGPPGTVHGGWVAFAFDEILGWANVQAGLSEHDREAHDPLPQAHTDRCSRRVPGSVAERRRARSCTCTARSRPAVSSPPRPTACSCTSRVDAGAVAVPRVSRAGGVTPARRACSRSRAPTSRPVR